MNVAPLFLPLYCAGTLCHPGTASCTIYDSPCTRPVEPAHPVEYAARIVWHGPCKILVDSMF